MGLLSALALALAGASGCNYAAAPEIHPERQAPAALSREWSAPSAALREEKIAPPSAPPELSHPLHWTRGYSLAQLISIALGNNPATRKAWEAARAAAARYGAARAPYYPTLRASVFSGYQNTPVELVGGSGVFKQWQVSAAGELTWTLLDFGRRRSKARLARERLIAANFSFNRKVQDVVFAVQRSFYALSAAHAAVIAARKNLELARADRDAAKQRLALGLATEPQFLLARQRVAESRFELADAELIVRDAQAGLALAAGLAADTPLPIESLRNQPIPAGLGAQVKSLIARTLRRRPDLAAAMARAHASDAALKRARAEFYPQLDLDAEYGEDFWNFTFKGPPTQQFALPQYFALMTFKWDLFTGFRRLNDVRAARAEAAAARADVKRLELDSIAQIWRAYWAFQAETKKYAYAQALLAASRDAYAANRDTYRQGLSTIVELLTAERDLARARYTMIQARNDLLTSYAAVAYASGAVAQ